MSGQGAKLPRCLVALKSALEKVRSVDKEGLVIQSPTGRVTIGKNHHVTMNMFLTKTQGARLVQVSRAR